MAKLDIAASQIQSTTNMIISGDTATVWSDAKYPSAKAALNNAHPIGSVVITNTNTSPATAINDTREWLGGTWELVDKEYSPTVNDNVYWTPTMSDTTARAEASGFVIRTNHLIDLTMQLTTKVVVSTANNAQLTLGGIDHGAIGGIGGEAARPLYFGFSGSKFANAVYTNGSTTEGCVIRYSLGPTGGFTIFEVYNANKQLPVGTTIYVNTSIPMDPEFMGDSFCDKFYWKRIA